MGAKAKLLEIGAKIGVVTITGRVYNEVRKEWEYLCRCRCGNEFKSRKDHLLKPKKGCVKCVNKVKADLDLANTISEEEYAKMVELKNFEKNQKKAQEQKAKEEKKHQAEEARAQRETERKERSRRYADAKLTNPLWLGQKFNRLTVIDSYTENAKTYWICECDCGNIVTKLAKSVKIGHFKSCGCIAREIMSNHKLKERLRAIWSGMKDRCLNPNNKNYHNYGGRGVAICEEWVNDYQTFRKWAYENGWTEEIPEDHKQSLSIERKDVNGNYEPQNCCFIPLCQQCLNKRPYSERNRIIAKKDKTMVTINGETKSLREWQKLFNVSNACLRYREKNKGLSTIDALLFKSHREVQIGSRVGNVTVLRRVYNGERSENEYECRCEVCGGEFRCRADGLVKPRVGCRACSNRITAANRAKKG